MFLWITLYYSLSYETLDITLISEMTVVSEMDFQERPNKQIHEI